jgi:predicted RNase H-like HicB family nuclease
MQFTAIVKKGEKQYVALCLEVDAVSQGRTVESALRNLKEAVERYIEEMGEHEGVGEGELIITHFGVKNAQTSHPVRA